MMNYISLSYYVLLVVIVAIYYLLPLRHRWMALLAGSGCFYYLAIGRRMQLVIFAASIGISYIFGGVIQHQRERGGGKAAMEKADFDIGHCVFSISASWIKVYRFLFGMYCP